MKKITSKLLTTASILALACAFSVPALRAADAPAPAPAAKPDKAAMAKADLEKYDKNHDGKLDAEEKKVRNADRLLEKYDKNKNGKIDADEQATIDADKAAADKAKAEKAAAKADAAPKSGGMGGEKK